MIAKTYIQENLRQLDTAYRKSQSPKHGLYFAKLAILELCGWIEVSMDDIVLKHCSRCIFDSNNTKYVEKQIVGRTSGFDYDVNFRGMLIRLVGIVTCEIIESAVDSTIDTKFKAHLHSLKTARNSLAHTYVKGKPGAVSIDAPSVTKARFPDLYEGLREYETVLKSL